MKEVRLRILLPVAFLLTLLVPAMRVLPIGQLIPDPWLLFLFMAVPVPGPESWKRPILLVVFLGGLRSSVSAISPFSSWAGLGLSLVVRHYLFRRISQHGLLLRAFLGCVSALPLAFFDLRAAQYMGVPFDPSIEMWRVLGVGVFWAFFHNSSYHSKRRWI